MIAVPVSERVGLRYTECVTCTGVVLGNIASRNAHPATYAEALALRRATGKTTPPLGPDDLARAYRVRYGWNAPTYEGTESGLIDAFRAGSWGAIHVIYGRVPLALRIQKDFTGGHCILVGGKSLNGDVYAGHVWVVDPLFYPNSGYTGVWWPEVTLMAALNVVPNPGPSRYPVPLATLLRPNQFARPADPQVRVRFGTFQTYTVRQDMASHVYRAIGTSRRFARVNTMIPVTPTETPVVNDKRAIPMRQITAGMYNGLWVVAHGALAYSE